MVIWDADIDPPHAEGVTILWRGIPRGSYAHLTSIPHLIEKNSEKLRSDFLAWIYSLGTLCINGKSLIDHLELRPGLSYWWMTLLAEKSNYGKSPQINDVIRFMALINWVDGHMPKTLKLISANESLACCISQWCGENDIPFKWQRLSSDGNVRPRVSRLYELLPFSLQGLIWASRYLFEGWALRGHGVDNWRRSKGDITFISYFFNLDRGAAKLGDYKSAYWGSLPDDLLRLGCKTNWLHLYVKNKSSSTINESVAEVNLFNKKHKGEQVHVFLESFLNWGVVARAISDWFQLALMSRHLEKSIIQGLKEKKEANLWTLFSRDWHSSMSGPVAFKNTFHFNLFEAAMKSLPAQRIGIFLQENRSWEFGLIKAWKLARHGCLVGAPHSSVRFWDLSYFYDSRSYDPSKGSLLPMPDKVAVNGKVATEAYLNGGYPPANLVQVEALRYMHLGDIDKNTASSLSSPLNSLRLLVLGDYLSSNVNQQMRLLEQAAQFFPDGMAITVKSHPSCPISPGDYPGISMRVIDEPIAGLLKECDIAYSSAVTTAAVDAYCAGVPVISILDPNIMNLSPLRGLKEVFFISTPREFIDALISISTERPFVGVKHDFFTIDKNLPRWRKMLFNNQ